MLYNRRSRVLAAASVIALAFAVAAMAAPPPLYYPPEHKPEQPKSGESVRINFSSPFVRFKNAVLFLQIVPPGEYIRKIDAGYQKKFVELPMTSGSSGNDFGAS